MISIKDVLDSLKPQQRREIFYAFDNNISYHIPLGDGRVLAVHSNNVPNFRAEATAGHWAIGRFVKVNMELHK
jgi:hypothetical protein